jgi:hypothetical protein
MTTASLNLAIAPGGEDPVPLLLWVRADQVLAVQARLTQFLVAEPAGDGNGGAYKPPFSSTYGPKDAWNLPAWRGDEQEAARWILGVVGDNQRRVLAYLISAGPDGVWTGQLRHAAGYDDSKSMSGVFKAIGGRFRSVGLKPLWNGGAKDPNKGQRLSVLDGNVRLLFANLIRSNYPALAAEFSIA